MNSAIRGLALGSILLAAPGGAPAQAAGVGTASDPVGDILGLGPDAPDVVRFSGHQDGATLTMRFDFSGPVSAPAGLIELDTDRDAGTGAVSDVAFLCPNLVPLGAEFTVDLFNADASAGTVPVHGAASGPVGQGTFRAGGDWLEVGVPLSLIGGDGTVNAAAILGSRSGASDCAPDAAFLVTGRQEGRSMAIPALLPGAVALLALFLGGLGAAARVRRGRLQ